MDIRQTVSGALFAAVLVLGADVTTAAQAAGVHAMPASAACAIRIEQAVSTAAVRAGNALLDIALNMAGELEARAKQIL